MDYLNDTAITGVSVFVVFRTSLSSKVDPSKDRLTCLSIHVGFPPPTKPGKEKTPEVFFEETLCIDDGSLLFL